VFVFPTETQARALIADWPSPAMVYLEPPSVVTPALEPFAVVRGLGPGEPLAPPSDPSTVTPFLPEWGAVLPAIEGLKMARPCSRRRPDRIMDVWTPDRANAFLPLVTPGRPTGVSETWQTQIVNACDGGERFFSARSSTSSPVACALSRSTARDSILLIAQRHQRIQP
jgi:hypothetical protein